MCENLSLPFADIDALRHNYSMLITQKKQKAEMSLRHMARAQQSQASRFILKLHIATNHTLQSTENCG
jgi:hypothetical protein